MKITSVDVSIVNSTSKLRGFATVVFDEKIGVKNFTIFSGQNGLFVGMPAVPPPKDKKTNGWDKIVSIFDKELFKELESKIIAVYKSKLADSSSNVPNTSSNEEDIFA